MRHLSIVVAACVAFLAACGPGGHEADEAAIREVNKKWQETIVAKDAAAVANFYAEDGQMLPPNAPKSVGREALQKSWAEMMALPGVTLTFDTEKFVFAKSGDLAVEIGTYKFSMGEGAAAVNDTGKAVVTWTKRDGKWQVLTDMFSSDNPPPPPPPAAAAAPPVEGVMPAPEGTPAPDGATPAGPTTPAPTTPAPTTPAPTTPNP